MNIEIDFSKSYEYPVEVFHETLGSLGTAELIFGGNGQPHILFESFFSNRSLVDGQACEVLKAKTKNGESFTLFGCKCYGPILYIDILVAGDVDGTFPTIEVRYSELSEWFLQWQRLTGEVGDHLTWSGQPTHLNLDVDAKGEKFHLESETVSDMTKVGEDVVIHEHVIFSFESKKSNFDTDDIQKKSLDLLRLFSILIAYPISIVSVRVTCPKGGKYYAYFPTYKKIDRDSSKDRFLHECFISKSKLDDHWKTIVENFYKSDYRDQSWVRLAGMQRYEGFWEYRALGYVILLDKFVSEQAKGQKKQTGPGTKRLSKLSRAIKKMNHPLTEAQHEDLMALIAQKFSGKTDLNFADGYEYATSISNPNIMRVINISPADFKYIKRLRDDIAHGHALDVGDNITPVLEIVNKITLLLTYWAFRDFGLSDGIFLDCMTNPWNQLTKKAGLNRALLARLTNTADFYQVSKKLFDKISTTKEIAFFPCFTQGKKGGIKYSKKYSDAYKAWSRSPLSKPVVEGKDSILGIEKSRIKYSPMAYMQCGEKEFPLHGVYIVNES